MKILFSAVILGLAVIVMGMSAISTHHTDSLRRAGYIVVPAVRTGRFLGIPVRRDTVVYIRRRD